MSDHKHTLAQTTPDTPASATRRAQGTRKVTTVTGWAVLPAGAYRERALGGKLWNARAAAVLVRNAATIETGEHRVVRLDITISEDDAAPARDGGAR